MRGEIGLKMRTPGQVEEARGEAAWRHDGEAAAAGGAVEAGTLEPRDAGRARRQLGIGLQHEQVSVGGNLRRVVDAGEQVAVPVGVRGLPFARGGGAAVGLVLLALEHGARDHVVHGEPRRGRRRHGAEALAGAEARHGADELGHVADVPDVPVGLAGGIAEVHFHHVEHRDAASPRIAQMRHSTRGPCARPGSEPRLSRVPALPLPPLPQPRAPRSAPTRTPSRDDGRGR